MSVFTNKALIGIRPVSSLTIVALVTPNACLSLGQSKGTTSHTAVGRPIVLMLRGVRFARRVTLVARAEALTALAAKSFLEFH
jgi:hypothetical protein